MRKVLTIASHDIRIFLSSRGNLVGLLFTPILMTLIIGFVNGGMFSANPTMIRVDVIDQDRSALSREFIDAVRQANDTLVLCPMDASESVNCRINNGVSFSEGEVEDRLLEGTTLAAIEIPDGFEQEVKSFQPVDVIYLSKQDFDAPTFIRQAVDSALQQVNGAAVAASVGSRALEPIVGQVSVNTLQEEIYQQAARLWNEDPVSIHYFQSGEIQQASALASLRTGLGQSVPGMGSMFVMFTVFGGMTAMVVERKQWTMQRLASMPLTKAQLLGGKILARFALGLLQFLVVFAVGLGIGMPLGDSPLGLVLVAFSFTLSVTAISFALGSRFENEQQASGFALLLSLILAPLGGAWWPLQIVPRFMQIAGHISPIAWTMDAFTSLIFEGGGIASILLPVGVLFGVAVLAFVLGVRLFRYD
ncbi:MAG: ABC transporter permease [Anaerolineales bacterium]|jgi:ABC-2 type transport system permease protein